jgi:integrase
LRSFYYKTTNDASENCKKLYKTTFQHRANVSQLQFATLLRELDDRPKSHAGLIIRFLALTGLRINEARQIKWCDVHLDFILVPGSVTKNGKPRHVPFVTGIQETLERLRAIKRDDFILPADTARRSLATACKLAGLPRLAHHDFRHMFATRCIESGVDMPTVARWLGHQDGGALLGRVCFHLADAHSREMAGRVRI